MRRAIATAALLIASAGIASAEMLVSPNYRVPGFTINSGCVSAPQWVASTMKGGACLGELGEMNHFSPNFRLHAGYCAVEQWLTSSSPTTGVPVPPLVTAVELSRPSPNPMTAQTIVEYALRPEDVGSLRVYDVSGRCVKTLFTGRRGPVRETFAWDGTGDAGGRIEAGLYFLRLETQHRSLTRKLALITR